MGVRIFEIYVTQVGFRNEAQLEDMTKYVKSGGFFSKEAIAKFNSNNPEVQNGWPIKLSQFEDGKIFCADGHHRLAAIVMGGRQTLHDCEYEIKQWKYSDYMSTNLASKWVTPLNPKTEIRISDYTEFKKQVFSQPSAEASEIFIQENKHMYIVKRNVKSIHDVLVRKMVFSGLD